MKLKESFLLLLFAATSHLCADGMGDFVRDHWIFSSVLGVSSLGLVIVGGNYGTQHLAGEVIDNAAETVLPAAELAGKNLITHTSAELKAILKSTLLSCCWLGVAFFGAKLAYDEIKEHNGELKSKQTLKASIGAMCVALAVYAVYKHFE